MSPIFIIAMVIVWVVIRQAKKAARQGMNAGGRAAGRSVRDKVRERMEGYRDVIRSRGEDVERRLEQATEEVEDRWSRAERLLGGEGPQADAEPPPGDTETWAADAGPDRDLEEPSFPGKEDAPWEGGGPISGGPVSEPIAPQPDTVPSPDPAPKLTPYETRAASREAATAAAVTAAAAAAELARAAAEPAVVPDDQTLTESVEADLSIHVLEKDLFESGRPGFEIEERFRDEFQGRRVRWSGLLDRAEASLGAPRVEVLVHEVDDDPVSRPLRWAFELDSEDAADLLGQREIPVTIEGTLDACDPYLRQVSLVNARRDAEARAE